MLTAIDQNSEIRAAIAATLARRRPDYVDMSHAWRSLCEAAHVAGLAEPARAAFLSQVTTQRGADTALRLREHAASIRVAVVQFLERRSSASCNEPLATATSAVPAVS
jgi:hypothetical protein